MIDACRDCRGIWLDRGELDKLIAAERVADEDFLREVRGERPVVAYGRDHDDYDHDDDDDRRGGRRKPKRRSILEEFLDFG